MRKNLGQLLRKTGKLITYGALGLASIMPMKEANAQEINEQDILNPFKQPNDSSLLWYGSGDVDSSGVVDGDDYDAMVNDVQNDMADIDGDGIASDTLDQRLLENYLNGNREYLPGMWNQLQTREERESWLEKMLAIDQTDTNTYISGDADTRFISGNFATQLVLNFFGYSGDDIPSKYVTEYNGRFNLPVYITGLFDPSGAGHGVNSTLVGDDPLNFDDWLFIEPQTDGTGGGSVFRNNIKDHRVSIRGIKDFNVPTAPDFPRYLGVLNFEIDSTGVDSLTYKDPNLILTRPDLPTIKPDTTAPYVEITSPEQDSTYTSHVTNLEYLVDDANPDSTWFSLNGGLTKTDYFGDSPITDIRSEQGENTWVVYHKDLVGHMSSDTVRFDVDTTSVGIAGEPVLPLEYTLKQNHPNPFNPLTKIEYTLPERGHVELNVYNAIGREVKTLVDEVQGPGGYTVNFSSENLPSGVYLYQLRTESGYTDTKKMAVVK